MKIEINTDWLNAQLAGATGIHEEALGNAQYYRDYYNGYTKLPSFTGRVNLVMKDVMRVVEGSLPSLVDPFLGKDIAIVEGQDALSQAAARENQTLINYQWNKKNDPLVTLETISRNLMIDGTSWTKVGWDSRGYATIESVPFESVIPDPSAYSVSDMQFVIYRRKVTVSDVLKSPEWFGKHTLTTLSPLVPSNDDTYEADDRAGREDTYNHNQRAMEELEVFEYYGNYDINKNGKTEPVVAIWCNDTLLNAFNSPYPGFAIPFDNATYISRPYSIYGIGVGGIIGDKQDQRTGIMRGIFDNMSRSNNAVKFVKKGALDATNFNRLKKGDAVVEINTGADAPVGNVIWDGNFNALPPDVYKMLDDIEIDEENLTGITKYAVGSDSRSLNQTATGVSIISSMSQRRLVFITQHISGLLARAFKKWMLMNQAYSPDNTLLQGEFDLFVRAGTAGMKEKKSNDIISMLQSLTNMPGSIDPNIVTMLIAELADNMDLDATAQQIRKQVVQSQEGSEEEKQQLKMRALAGEQLAMEAEQAKIMKDKAIAAKDMSIAREHHVDTAIAMAGGN